MSSPVLLLVLLLPLATALPLETAGVRASAADVLALAAVGLHWSRKGLRGVPFSDSWALFSILLLGLWIGLSGAWGNSTGHALARAAGVLGWGGVAWTVRVSGLPLRRVLFAWLAGAGAMLAVSAGFLFFDPSTVLYHGGASLGGHPRFTALTPHPNFLGDYLVVTLCVWLAARAGQNAGGSGGEPAGRKGGRKTQLVSASLLLGILASIVTAVTTAWAGVGLIMVVMAFRWGRGSGAFIVGIGGVGLIGLTLLGAARALEFDVLGLSVATSGIRPAIWADALAAAVRSPWIGVGARPFLADAADPGNPVGLQLWDAHSLPLSIWAQFGLIGGGLWAWVVSRLVSVPGEGSIFDGSGGSSTSSNTSSEALLWLWVALIAVGLHGLLTANEDLRHIWLLLGVIGLARSESEAGAGPSTGPERTL